MGFLSQGIDDRKVLLGSEAGEGYAGSVLRQVKQKGWAWRNWSGMVSSEVGDNLNVPALKKLEHSSAVRG